MENDPGMVRQDTGSPGRAMARTSRRLALRGQLLVDYGGALLANGWRLGDGCWNLLANGRAALGVDDHDALSVESEVDWDASG